MHTQNTRNFTLLVIGSLVAGAAVGYLCQTTIESSARQKQIVTALSVVSDVFLRLIKMIVAPLVLATLLSGIARMGGGAALTRIAVRALLWFVMAGLTSLLIGMLAANLLNPGAGLALPAGATSAVDLGKAGQAHFDLATFITNLVPRSIFEALANNEILQIVIFALFAGLALAALGERGAPLLRAVDALVHLMLQITQYVMRIAPLAVFCAMAAVVLTQGIEILFALGRYVGGFFLALAVLWAVVLGAGYIVLGSHVRPLVRAVREPVMLAFATASSEAAYPRTLAQLGAIGVPERISGFVLPLGYSFNLDGSMMYCAFALLFIAEVYGVHLSLLQQAGALLLLMVMSKGLAGVPRASLFVVAAALPHVGLPEAGMLLILGVDHLLDMGRTATNVLGNSVATAVIAKWEGAVFK